MRENEYVKEGISMSYDAIAWAYKQSGLKLTPKAILVCIAWRHNGKDNRCFPSHATIAEDAGTSRSVVRDNIKKLEKLGLVTIEKRFHEGTNSMTSHSYILNFDVVITDDKTTKTKSEGTVCYLGREPANPWPPESQPLAGRQPTLGRETATNKETNKEINREDNCNALLTQLPASPAGPKHVEIFKYGRQVFGKNQGGSITKQLIDLCGPDEAWRLINCSARAAEPVAYARGCIKNQQKQQNGYGVHANEENRGRSKLQEQCQAAGEIADKILAERKLTGISY